MALEPWHVMGEESGAGGTARYVDSSLERLEVKATGLVGDRHVVTCNGRARAAAADRHAPASTSPACATAPGTAPSALHPTIGVHAPLIFDLVDTWMQRSLGGCQYHVAHPGGLNYTTFPVNAYEAEARRLARFFRTGHTPGTMMVPQPSRPTPTSRTRSTCVGPHRARCSVSVAFALMLDQLARRLRGARGRAYDELLAAPRRGRGRTGTRSCARSPSAASAR